MKWPGSLLTVLENPNLSLMDGNHARRRRKIQTDQAKPTFDLQPGKLEIANVCFNLHCSALDLRLDL